MKWAIRLLGCCFLVSAVSLLGEVPCETGEREDQSLSPYFFVKTQSHGDDAIKVDQLPLRSTAVDIRVAGVIADVTIRQVYYNQGQTPLEATYVFPASTRAAVYGLKMRTGDREITAAIRERKKAKQEYTAAKKEGKRATLLEQQRPNVFQMNVANIMPADEIEVELRYTELIIPEKGTYAVNFPTVVGPRYTRTTAEGAAQTEQWTANPYLKEGEIPEMTYDIHVSLASGVPIQDVACESHDVDVEFSASSQASVALRPGGEYGGNRDFILKYRLAGEKVESGLLLFEGQEENFFLLMVQPPQTVGVTEMPPREYTFVVDVSGSMHGFPLDTSKTLLKDLIGGLSPRDRFNVLLFAGNSSVLSEEPLAATESNIARAIGLIDRQTGGGGTELMPALQRAYAMKHQKGMARSIVIATDGYVSVEREAFQLIGDMLGEANVFAFGIGSSVNRYLIEGMARAGMGEPFVVTSPSQAAARAKALKDYIASPALTDIEIDFGDLEVYDVNPGSIPDCLAERPVIVFGKWRGRASGDIRVTGMGGEGPFEQRIRIDGVVPHADNGALRYLWARHRIAILDDYNRLDHAEDRIGEVTALGLKYNLLTQYTSFLAIDKVVANPEGDLAKVKQPVPVPKGVPNSAVGGAAAAPEPETYALMAVGVILMFVAYRRRKMQPCASESSRA